MTDAAQYIQDAQDNRPSCYFEPPNLIFRASGISNCPTRLAHIAMGRVEEFPPAVLKAFADGHVFEEVLLLYLTAMGIHIQDRQKEITYSAGENLIIRGHIDGIFAPSDLTGLLGENTIDTSDGKVLFEAKSASLASYENFVSYGLSKYPGYMKQLQLYCTSLGCRLAIIVFICKTTHRTHAQVFNPLAAENLALLDEVKSTCARTLSAIQQIVTTGESTKCNEFRKQTFQCPFADLHDDSDSVQVNDLNLEVLLDEYDAVKNKLNELVEQHKQMRSIIERRLFQEGASRVVCGGHYFQMEGDGKSYTDYNAIRQQHPELIKWEEENKRPGKPYLKIYKVKRK